MQLYYLNRNAFSFYLERKMHLPSVRKVFFKTNIEVSGSYSFVAKKSQKPKQERDVC